MSKDIAKVWEFASSSSNAKYETLQYVDSTTSCNCPGWTRRVAADGSRSCKHTRMVDMGTADRECAATHDYTRSGVKAPAKVQASAPLAAPTKKTAKGDQVVTPVRRILWNKQGG